MRVVDAARTHFYHTVGDTIRVAREAAGLSIVQLAANAGITDTAVRHAEDGQTCSLHVLAKLAHELDTTLDALVPLDALR